MKDCISPRTSFFLVVLAFMMVQFAHATPYFNHNDYLLKQELIKSGSLFSDQELAMMTCSGGFPTDIMFSCEDQTCLEVIGDGIKNALPSTVTISDPGSVDVIYVEALFNDGAPADVTFSTNNGQTETISRTALSGSCAGFYYRTCFNPASTVSIMATDAPEAEAFIVYVQRSGSACLGKTSSGTFTETCIYRDTLMFTLPLPVTSAPKDVEVEVPLSELTEDGRPATIEITACGVSSMTTVTGSDPALGSSLNIVSAMLSGVSAPCNQVMVEVQSPTVPNGQSLYVSGIIASMVTCDICEVDVDQFTQHACDDNGTPNDPTDDFFRITINASNIGPGTSNQYEVVYNGTVLATSSYGTPVTVGTPTTPPFRADGSSTYDIVIRDRDDHSCSATRTTTPSMCDVPDFDLTKTITDISRVNDRTFDVTYSIEVENNGDGAGVYDLDDEADYDDDINIVSASYSSNAPGNSGSVLNNSGNWLLANNQLIAGNTTHTYTLIVRVNIDLSTGSSGNNQYSACGSNGGSNPIRGEGLFNIALLDINEDGNADFTDHACGDLPYVIHDKSISSINQTGPRTYNVNYQISVENLGGATGSYNLSDSPNFDDDISVNSAMYTSDAPGNAGGPLTGSGPWSLASDQSIAGATVHAYALTVSTTIDLSSGSGGNNSYTECGSATPGNPRAGEGLYNESELDIDDDGQPEEEDEVCDDLPYISHEKTVSSLLQTGGNTFRVIYKIEVTNTGGASGEYNLVDAPGFDDDIAINSASYTSTAPGNSGGPLTGSGPWTLATDQNINQDDIHVFMLTVDVTLDLSSGSGGDNQYTPCGTESLGNPRVGEGLFNESQLDIDDDGESDEEDDACADLPAITHEKTISSITNTGDRRFQVTYQIQVRNDGGLAGEYDLVDVPSFDDDIEILSANFNTTAPGNPGSSLSGSGPWVLANDQTIGTASVHIYNLIVNVEIDLSNSSDGDNQYTSCEEASSGNPVAGEGLFNESRLDINNDGQFDEIDNACGDLPYVVHEKTITSLTQTGARTYDVEYSIEVNNLGGADGEYNLSDNPSFDDDIDISMASFSSDAPGNSGSVLVGAGPWTLATDQSISGLTTHNYNLAVSVTIDLSTGSGGDNSYTECGNSTPSNPRPGEGLYNLSELDIDDDGQPEEEDEVCEDLPYIVHEKSNSGFEALSNGQFRVEYAITVTNNGGTTGTYNLNDLPQFDDDINILSASFSSNIGLGGMLSITVPSGGWILAEDQSIIEGQTHTFTLTVFVELDLSEGSPGDNELTDCGTSTPGIPVAGEGLFNQSLLDVDDDGEPDEDDKVCRDLPLITHEKDLSSIELNADGSFTVTYSIQVRNESDIRGFFSLRDMPLFDQDIVIIGARYQSTIDGNTALPTTPPVGGWLLADNESLSGSAIYLYTLSVDVELDLNDTGTPGDGEYTACGETMPGDSLPREGLFNESRLDLNSDGTPDQVDDACGDLPFVTHEKTFVSGTQISGNRYEIEYEILVENEGGAIGSYNLWDIPGFDDDFVIISAEYVSDAPDNTGGGLSGTRWDLAMDQFIDPSEVQSYSITVIVEINLSDPASPGDEIYVRCGTETPGNPTNGEGLFNESFLDRNDDGMEDEVDETCGDVDIIDLAATVEATPGIRSYGDPVEFKVKVFNQGNVDFQTVTVTEYIPDGYSFIPGGANAGWTQVGDNVQYTFTNLDAPGMQMVTLELILEMTDGGVEDWKTFVEITGATDDEGDERSAEDVDSTPGSDTPLERSVDDGDVEDNDVTGSGPGRDEDDHDPADIIIFDLAQIKKINPSSPSPYVYGQDITFDIEVYNQGNETATDISIVDYIADGFAYDFTKNPTWTQNNTSTPMTTITSLAPGSFDVVSIVLTFQQSDQEDAWVNISEIEGASSPRLGIDPDDVDSTPDTDDDNDPGGQPDTDDDDNIDGNGKNGEDEDDHDPSRPPVLDLGMKKTVLNKKSFYLPGEIVPYQMTVYNQGNVPVQDVVLGDYMPPGFIFDGGRVVNADWNNNAGTLEYTITDRILGGDSIVVDLELEVQISTNPMLSDWTNFAEILEIRDTTGTIINDNEADSTPGSDSPTERDVVPGGPDDNNVDGDSKNAGEDEDDHDPEKIEVTGSIGDLVFDDLDGDGIQDPGEPGLEGVELILYKCDGTEVARDTSDADGAYLFEFLLPLMEYYIVANLGSYAPEYGFADQDQGSDDSKDSDVNLDGVGECIHLDPGEMNEDYDIGLVKLASLGDFVWEDEDGDGRQDIGEPGVEEVIVVLLDDQGNEVARDTTDVDGRYLFEFIRPGDYQVQFILPGDFEITESNIGNDNLDSDVIRDGGMNITEEINLSPGEINRSVDAGLYICIPIGDFVWFDLNANGIQDGPENGFNGVKVFLKDENGKTLETQKTRRNPNMASNDGFFKFCVSPGTYYLVFQRPGHLAPSDPFVGTKREKDSDVTNTIELYSTYLFTVRSGDMNCDVDAGFHVKATMGDRVWLDENGNGVQDGSEPRMANVTISAYSEEGVMFWQTKSDANGEFNIDGLSKGEYYLQFDPPAGYTFTTPDAGGDDGRDSDVDGSNGPRTTALYRVNPGEHEPDVDAGLVSGFLPIELIEFTAQYVGEKVDVRWTTAVEINNDYYEVERRHESEANFRVVGMVGAAGTVYTTQDYGYDDYDVSRSGVYYYRLRQVDTDGTDARSEVRVVEVGGAGNGVDLYPNPASNVLNVEIRTTADIEDVTITIVDPLGRILPEFTMSREIESGVTVEELNIENLVLGMYTVKIKIGTEVERLRFTKI